MRGIIAALLSCLYCTIGIVYIIVQTTSLLDNFPMACFLLVLSLTTAILYLPEKMGYLWLCTSSINLIGIFIIINRMIWI